MEDDSDQHEGGCGPFLLLLLIGMAALLLAVLLLFTGAVDPDVFNVFR